jgi:hypothetical protein
MFLRAHQHIRAVTLDLSWKILRTMCEWLHAMEYEEEKGFPEEIKTHLVHELRAMLEWYELKIPKSFKLAVTQERTISPWTSYGCTFDEAKSLILETFEQARAVDDDEVSKARLSVT